MYHVSKPCCERGVYSDEASPSLHRPGGIQHAVDVEKDDSHSAFDLAPGTAGALLARMPPDGSGSLPQHIAADEGWSKPHSFLAQSLDHGPAIGVQIHSPLASDRRGAESVLTVSNLCRYSIVVPRLRTSLRTRPADEACLFYGCPTSRTMDCRKWCQATTDDWD